MCKSYYILGLPGGSDGKASNIYLYQNTRSVLRPVPVQVLMIYIEKDFLKFCYLQLPNFYL